MGTDPAETPRGTPLENALGVVLGALAFAALACAVAVVALRAGHPFELEWMEGWCLDQVARVRSGLPEYAAPSLEFAALNYPPLYFRIAAAFAGVFGDGLPALRVVSWLASLGTLALVALLARRETGRSRAALVAAGLLAATAPWHGHWFDIGRPDALYAFLLLASVALLRAPLPPLAGGVAAGLVAASAFFTKQSAIVALAPLFLWLAFTDRRRALGFALGFAPAALVVSAALDRATGGWHRFYVYTVAASHHPMRALAPAVLHRDVFPILPALFVLALGGALAALRSGTGGERRGGPRRTALGFWTAALAGPLASGLWLRLYPGGWNNVLLSAAPFLALGATLGREAIVNADAGAPRRLLSLAGGAALAVQFALFAYDPRPHVPTAADRAAGERVVAAIAAIPGDVYVTAHPWLARRAGKPPRLHEMALHDLRDCRDPVARRFVVDVERALASDRFSAVVLDHSEDYEWLYDRVRRFYPHASGLPLATDEFWTVAGARTRPERVQRP